VVQVQEQGNSRASSAASVISPAAGKCTAHGPVEVGVGKLGVPA